MWNFQSKAATQGSELRVFLSFKTGEGREMDELTCMLLTNMIGVVLSDEIGLL